MLLVHLVSAHGKTVGACVEGLATRAQTYVTLYEAEQLTDTKRETWSDVEEIDARNLTITEDNSSNRLSDMVNMGIKDCIHCGAPVPVAQVASVCDGCIARWNEAHPNDKQH